MDDFLNQGWFAIQVAWTRIKYELSGNVILLVTAASVLLLLWIFLLPKVRNK